MDDTVRKDILKFYYSTMRLIGNDKYLHKMKMENLLEDKIFYEFVRMFLQLGVLDRDIKRSKDYLEMFDLDNLDSSDSLLVKNLLYIQDKLLAEQKIFSEEFERLRGIA